MTVKRLKDLKVRRKLRDLAVSISNSITEEFERKTNPDFIVFLSL